MTARIISVMLSLRSGGASVVFHHPNDRRSRRGGGREGLPSPQLSRNPLHLRNLVWMSNSKFSGFSALFALLGRRFVLFALLGSTPNLKVCSPHFRSVAVWLCVTYFGASHAIVRSLG